MGVVAEELAGVEEVPVNFESLVGSVGDCVEIDGYAGGEFRS